MLVLGRVGVRFGEDMEVARFLLVCSKGGGLIASAENNLSRERLRISHRDKIKLAVHKHTWMLRTPSRVLRNT